MPDWLKLILEAIPILAGVFAMGRFAAKAEHANDSIKGLVHKVEDAVTKLDAIPVLAARIEQVQETVTRHRSDFKDLQRGIQETRDIAVRAEMASSHDWSK